MSDAVGEDGRSFCRINSELRSRFETLVSIMMANVSSCALCPRSGLGFCNAVLGEPGQAASEDRSWQDHRVVAPGKLIVSRNQCLPDVFVLCDGWGIRFLQMPDGRRQILSFLLPGDLFSVAMVHQERVHFFVRAVTPVQISAMARVAVQSQLAKSPTGLSALARSFAFEVETSDELAAMLGRGSAEERMAYLFLHLTKRIAARNVIRDERYPIPLRQQHIADATGLTPVHVSRTLRLLRERRIVEFSSGILEVLDPPQLERLGSLR